LHLHKIAWLHDLLVMKLFTLLASCLDPLAHGLGLKAEGRFDRWNRTAVADQSHDAGNRLLGGAAAKEDRAGACASVLLHTVHLKRGRLRPWPWILPWATCPLAGQAVLGQNIVCGSIDTSWRVMTLEIVAGFASFSSADGQPTV
jgi:hypothetical protein